MLFWLLFVCLFGAAVSIPSKESTSSQKSPEIPAYFYSTVTSFSLQTNTPPPPQSRRLQQEEVEEVDLSTAPYGSHIDLTFGTEGRLSRNYTNIRLQLNHELFSSEYVVTLDGQPLKSASQNTAYKANLPDDQGWVRVTLVPNHPELFHAFIFHADEQDMIVVEPLQTSELSRTSNVQDTNPTHRNLRDSLQRETASSTTTTTTSTIMVAYSHGRDAHPSVTSDAESSWHQTRRVLHEMSQRRRRRRLGNAMGVPVQEQISTYLGPYGTASGCPATVQKMKMGLAADAGFYTGVSGTAASSGADLVAAYINNMINLANVIFVDQFNIFLSIGEYLMYSSTSSSPTFSGGDWNQKPSDATRMAGTARGDYGCYISRYEKQQATKKDR